MKKFSVIGATLTGNRGAEAMLTTVIGRLRELFPETRFNVFSYYPKDDKRLTDDPTVRIYSSTPLYLIGVLFPASFLMAILQWLRLSFLAALLPASVKALAESDVLLDLAGVSFIDGREKFLPFNVLTIWPAMLLGVPVVKLSQAMGPFHNYPNRLLAKIFLKRCAKIFARGEKTFEHLRGIGINEEKLTIAADIAFCHNQGDSLTKENEEHAAFLAKRLEEFRTNGKLVFGICPSSVIASKARKTGWDYPGLLARIAERFIAEGLAVLIFPNATRENAMNNPRNNDLTVIREMVERLRVPGIINQITYVDRDINTDSIKKLIRYCDAAMVSRFHAMVAALSTSTPVLVLGWSHKYLEVMERFNLPEYAFDCSNHDGEGLIAKTQQLFTQRDVVRYAIDKNLKTVMESSAGQFRYLKNLLSGSARTD